MFKRLFAFSANGNGASSTGALGTVPAKQGLRLMELEDGDGHRSGRSPSSDVQAPAKAVSFEQIYHGAAVKPPRIAYGILKVADMADSPHLAGMTPEAKRCALLMALEAAGAEIEDLLQDAVVRQRALNDYEEGQQERLREIETAKAEENRTIQAELDQITCQYMARIQANVDEVAREQDNLRNWQKRKEQECQRMTDAAAFVVSQGSAFRDSTLTSVLERASSTRR